MYSNYEHNAIHYLVHTQNRLYHLRRCVAVFDSDCQLPQNRRGDPVAFTAPAAGSLMAGITGTSLQMIQI